MKPSDFLIDIGKPVAYYPALRKITGSTNANIFLCQLLYWTGKQSNVDGWIYKTSIEIEEETGLSYKEQKTARNKLIDVGVLEEDYKRLQHVIYYRVVLSKIDDMWELMQQPYDQRDVPEPPVGVFGKRPLRHSLNESENTSENTTEIGGDMKSLEELSKEAAFVVETMVRGSSRAKENKNINSVGSYPADIQKIVSLFAEKFNLIVPRGSVMGKWIKDARDFMEMIEDNGVDPGETIDNIYDYIHTPDGESSPIEGYEKFSVHSLGSVLNITPSIIGKMLSGKSIVPSEVEKITYDADGNRVVWKT